MVRFALDLQELSTVTTDRLAGFTEALLNDLPGLATHGCSRGHPGGLVERLWEGTLLGHVIEHVALELQKLAGSPAARGKTRADRHRAGVYHVLFAYDSEIVGLAAGRLAVELVAGLVPGLSTAGLNRLHPPIAGLEQLTALVAANALGPSTQSLVDEARRRGIPVQRIDAASLVRLGWGRRQRLFRASIPVSTSHLGVVLAADKRMTKHLLGAAGVPVPRGETVRTADAAVDFARRAGTRIVVKPLNGNHGRGVTTGLLDEAAVRDAFDLARTISRDVIVEEHLIGGDHRLLVVGGRLVAAAERVAASVVGDGASTVGQLIDALNLDPRRGAGHSNVMTRVTLDVRLTAVLAAHGSGLDSVPEAGQRVVLRETANLSTGGEAVDRTDDVHPEVRAVAEHAAALIGLDVAGVDLLTTDITRPLSETGGGIVEVNAAPGLRMHLQPSVGQPRNVAASIIDQLYPVGTRSRIPVIAVTGTNGKSTTTRMIAHILSAANAETTVGMTTTSGVYIGGRRVLEADSSGPKSARMVLADPTVDVAVLETARGGLLREGLAYDRADVGIVLNVSADHLGLRGIETLGDLARVKSVVSRRVRGRGVSVLNADDRYTRRMSSTAGGRLAWFTVGARSGLAEKLGERLQPTALLATVEPSPRGGIITLVDGEAVIPLIEAADIPATLNGAATFNTANALAAALAAYASGTAHADIAMGLASFDGSFEQNPGRLNITTAPGFTTIVDYAHNPAALRALGDLVWRMRADHDRVIGVISTPGDRRDSDISQLGTLSAQIFDEVVFRELPDGRGRASGGVVSLLSESAQAAGMDASRIHRVMDESDAMEAALRMATERDLVVLTVSNVTGVWNQVNAFTIERARSDA